jgi:uncharacterized protein (DUF486 family)
MIKTIGLLVISNLFMTFAWYGHLKDLKAKPLYIAILVSWFIALAEYIFQVPANRIGINHFSLPQLKIIQEIITMIIFAAFAVLYMKTPISKNFLYASVCMVGAAYFIFKDA